MDETVLIGTLKPGSVLGTAEGEIRLTQGPPAAGTVPAAFPVPEADIGRLAVVSGKREGDVLHSVRRLEIAPPVLGSLLRNLLARETISEADLREALAEVAATEAPARLCALVIGHKKASPGAVNARTGLTEFAFNEDLAMRIETRIRATVAIQRVYRRTYRELPDDINALDPDFVVSLHCNAFDGQASGTEVLYYHRSQRGRHMAATLQQKLVAALGLPDRGIQPRTTEDRGGYLLRYTRAPCVIAEPFFIDNDADLARAQADPDALAAAYAQAIEVMASEIVS